ncbi:hypothetical protein GCM10010833_24350 [Blastomonas aquatica]|uniref:Uncharacterized protein n=2 Tax=Blastomonas aquatica TaxID=1510276 RepID=A0ABQ1JK14_9SPHN|nr:hypothetical protein GCM10010833_24350 [Blastomonas aquatica]
MRGRRIFGYLTNGAIFMRNFAIVGIAALALGVSACSADTENKAGAAAEAAGDDIEANVDAAGEAIENTMDDVEASVDKAARDLDVKADRAGDSIENEFEETDGGVAKNTN